MPLYLVQGTCTPEAWAAMLQNPSDRSEAIRALGDRRGGRMVGYYFAVGEYDVVCIWEFPDNVSASAAALAVTSGGALKAIKTTPLMTVEEAMQAMRRPGEARGVYQPPAATT